MQFSEVEAKLAAAERSLTESILAREELEESHLNSAEKERSMHASIVEKLEGRVKYFETLCNEAQKELDEWKKK